MSSGVYRRVSAALATLLIAGCSGGGCSSCAGGALGPIPGSFPLTPERRIPHALQLRLSDQGLQSLQSIGPDVLSGFVRDGIDVPTVTGDFGVGRYVICPSPPCRLTIELPATPPPLELAFAPADQLAARIRVILRGDIPVHTCTLTCDSMCHGSFCPAPSEFTIGVDTRRGAHPFVGLSTNVAVRRDVHPERLSYYRADIVSPTGMGDAVQETPAEGIEDEDFSCTGTLCGLFGVFRGTILDQFRTRIGGALAPIQDALSETALPDPPGCTTGTHASGTFCAYADDTRVPALLGVNGTGNFGALLASVTPGLRAPGSYVIAAGDPAHNAEVSATGMTVNVFGAVVSGGHSACVPRLTPPALPTIPEWTNLRQNLVPGTTTTPDLGVGLAEGFLDHALFNLWDAGMFCLGVNTRLSQSLNASLFAAAIPSLRNVVFPARSTPMALVLRPQQPPRATVGSGRDVNTDPLLSLEFARLGIDVYAFSEERYVRVLSALTDLTVPMNLARDMAGLRLSLGTVAPRNTTVTNSGLLTAQPAQLAGILEALLGTAVGMFAGNVPAIALPQIAVPGPGGMPVGTVSINVLDNGVRGVAEGMSRYVALYANLAYRRAGAMPATLAMDTAVEVSALPFDARVYEFGADFAVDRLPAVRVAMRAPDAAGRAVEFSYRVDGAAWSEWSRQDVREVRAPSFVAQGGHYVEARARLAGVVESEDPEPARADFAIDAERPEVRVRAVDGAALVAGWDAVAPPERLTCELSFDGRVAHRGACSEAARTVIPRGVTEYSARVVDPSGNEATAAGSVRALVAAAGGATPEPGCSCRAGGGRGARGRGAGVAGFSLLGALARRRARRRAARRR